LPVQGTCPGLKHSKSGARRIPAEGIRVLVEIVTKKKGCTLCDLAIGILEEIAPEFDEDTLKWEVVDMGNRKGISRFDALTQICGRRPSVPSIIINERIAFDHIPDFEALTEVVRTAFHRR